MYINVVFSSLLLVGIARRNHSSLYKEPSNYTPIRLVGLHDLASIAMISLLSIVLELFRFVP
jgi:hypothetical protein